MPTIRIDDEVYEWLQGMARPFEDTPNSVLRRVAGLAVGGSGKEEKEKEKEEDTANARAPRHGREKTPQAAFRQPILSVLERLGGAGRRMQVLGDVERLLADRLTVFDKSDIPSGGQRWQKSAEWEVRVMREQGLLKQVSEAPSGVWELTPKGREEAKS